MKILEFFVQNFFCAVLEGFHEASSRIQPNERFLGGYRATARLEVKKLEGFWFLACFSS